MNKRDRLAQILSTNFGLIQSQSMPDSESEYFKRLQELLSERIAFLINTDMEKLLHLLYKIDVDQRQTDQAFDLGEVKKISMKLSELIINRQLRKIDYAREFYNKGN